jgi:hypothetical protein
MSITPPVDQPPSIVVSMIAAVLRHGLNALGATLISSGVITTSQGDSLVEYGVGAAAIIASILWSYLEKRTKISQINTLIGNTK